MLTLSLLLPEAPCTYPMPVWHEGGHSLHKHPTSLAAQIFPEYGGSGRVGCGEIGVTWTKAWPEAEDKYSRCRVVPHSVDWPGLWPAFG